MRLLVVGGGVAGPAVALAAARLGMEATVLERRAVTDPEEGSWVTVAPNGLDALDVLGVLDEARAVGHPSRTNRMFGATGRHLGDVPLGAPLADGSVALTAKRSALAVVLGRAATPRAPRCAMGADVVDTQDDADGVRAVLADGTTVEGDLLVAADGVRSRSRRAIDPAAPDARYVGLTNFGGITRGTDLGLALEPEAWHFVFGRRCFFGAHPPPTGDVVWFVNAPREPIGREERAATSEREWLDLLAASSPTTRGPPPPSSPRARSSSPATAPTTSPTSRPGGAAAPSSSATRRTPRARAAARVWRSPSRTPSCWRGPSPPTARTGRPPTSGSGGRGSRRS